jgi:hypothetical protein
MCQHVEWILFFFLLCDMLNIGVCVRHIAQEGQVEWTTLAVANGRTNSNCPHISFGIFHNVTCYTNSIISHIHVNTTKLHNITCTLVATYAILRSLECSRRPTYLTARSNCGNKIGFGCLLQLMARRHMSMTRLRSEAMAESSIMGVNVPPCIQSGTDTSARSEMVSATHSPGLNMSFIEQTVSQ